MKLALGRLDIQAGTGRVRVAGRFWLPDGLHLWWGGRGVHLFWRRSRFERRVMFDHVERWR
jgi:hypothetical protein